MVDGASAEVAPALSRWRIASVLPLAVVVLVAVRASEPIGDNGFLWHIRAGTEQAARGTVLTTDPFSFTEYGSPWRTQSWLLELGYGWLEGWFASLSWANWLVFACGTAVVAAVGLAAVRRNRSAIALTLALVVFAWLLAPFAQPRPVIVSYALLALLVLAVTHRTQLAWSIPLILWVFAAVHGSWVLGLGLVLLEWIRTRDAVLAKAGAAGVVATLLTPHGIGAWGVVLDFARSSGALDHIVEWSPPDFGDVAQAPYLLIVLAVLIGIARGGIRLRDLVVVAPFLLFGLTAQRTVVPAAIVLIPWAVAGLPEVRSRPMVRPSIAAVSAAMLVVVGIAPMLTRPLGTVQEGRFPRPELTAALPSTGVFHDTSVGGYLIYERWPDLLVYIDDRAELYGEEAFVTFQSVMAGEYRSEFARWSIDTVLVEVDTSLARQLESDGWTRRDTDGSFVLLESPG